ncbi:MAG: CUAEP/CCAEP-tail radical SAM protein, partial [Chloroflexota bacterium]
MNRPGEILLVACYELGHQPLTLASPLGLLIDAGYKPAALDLSIESLSSSAVAQARFVAISVPMHTALRLGEQAAERVRQINPAAHICFYGTYAWLNADYLLRGAADSVIAGECEDPLLDLIQSLERGEAGPIAGVSTREHRAGPYLRRLRFVTPHRESLPPLTHYARFVNDGDHRLAGYVEASRGCLHTCLHCPLTPIYNGRFIVVPADIVCADVRAQVSAGATHITFGDPDFLNGPGHSLKVLRAVHAEFPTVTFDFTTKVEHILEYRHLFREFRALGCAFVVSAFESTGDVVLAHLDKGHTRADMNEALQIVAEAGIPIRPSWVAFTPWTTLVDYCDVLEFVEANGLIDHVDPVQYAIRLLIPPHSW